MAGAPSQDLTLPPPPQNLTLPLRNPIQTFRIVPNKDAPAFKVRSGPSLGPRFIACAMGARASANGGPFGPRASEA